MKIGFLTACLPSVPLDELVKWASKQGYQMLEVAAWPIDNTRDYSGSSIDVATLNESKAAEVKKLFADNSMEISSLAYYDNNLHSDPATRKRINEHLKKVIDAANLLDVNMVGTFVGRNITKSIDENLAEYRIVFGELLDYAKSKNVRLMFENCPMPGWQAPGVPGNLAYSPELLRELFKIASPEWLGLNIDPSHFYWLGIDYLKVIDEFSDRICHAHAKDTEILTDGIYESGIYGNVLAEGGHGGGWWRYRMPGLGEIDWAEFIAKLMDSGYDGVISTEHEDPVWGGTEERIKRGLILGYKHLSPLIV